MSFGRPLMIVTGGNGIRLPEAIDDDRLSEEAGKWNTPLRDRPSLLESYIRTIQLYDILGQVLDREEHTEAISSENFSASQEEEISKTAAMLKLDTKILEWRDSLPEYLQYDPSAKECSNDEAVSSDGVETPQVDFLAQAKRLYTRYSAPSQLI